MPRTYFDIAAERIETGKRRQQIAAIKEAIRGAWRSANKFNASENETEEMMARAALEAMEKWKASNP